MELAALGPNDWLHCSPSALRSWRRPLRFWPTRLRKLKRALRRSVENGKKRVGADAKNRSEPSRSSYAKRRRMASWPQSTRRTELGAFKNGLHSLNARHKTSQKKIDNRLLVGLNRQGR